MTDGINETSRPWGAIAEMWAEFFTPPSRISTDELRQYGLWCKRLSDKLPNKRALVLGATPELREMLFQNGFQVTCIDLNLDMILAMNALLHEKDPRETLVCANWLDNPLRDQYYGVVVGDAVLPNIPYEDRPKLLREIRRMTSPGGVYITRAFYARERPKYRSLAEILALFHERKERARAALELVLELQLAAFDYPNRTASFAEAERYLEQGLAGCPYPINDNIQAALELLRSFWFKKFIDKKFIFATQGEEEELYREFFSIEERFKAIDHPYGDITPMYLLSGTPS